jgi:hypothetical protein
MKIVIAALTAIVLLSTGTPAHASPYQPQRCAPSDVRTADMSGVYENLYMKLVLDSCGHALVVWENAFGTHRAYYSAISREVRGGGALFQGALPDPDVHGYLDSTDLLGLRPMEPGWVAIDTLDQSASGLKASYRLYRWDDYRS